MTPIPGITRYPSQRGTGWLARFYAAERVHTKLFSDGRYGGDPARSQAAARRWLAELSRCVEPVPRFRRTPVRRTRTGRSEEHTSELQSRVDLVCRLLLEKKKRPHRFCVRLLHWLGLTSLCRLLPAR